MKRSVLAVCLLACGNDNVHHLADSGTDAPPNNPDAPMPPSPVTVTVTQNGQPVAGLSTYFQNADSTVVAMPLTDANGQASAIMSGGFVTVLEPPTINTVVNGQQIDTFTGVKPGDDLHVDVDIFPANVTITFNLTVPTDPDPNVVNYELHTSCGNVNITPPAPALRRRGFAGAQNPPAQVQLVDCNGVADMLVTTNDINGVDLDAFFVPAQAVADQVDVTLDATYAPLTAQTFDYANLPANVVDINLDEELLATHGLIYDAPSVQGTPLTGTAEIPDRLPDPTGATQLTIHSFAPDSSIFSAQVVTDWGAPNAGGTLDYAAAKLGDYTTQPTFDFTGHQVTWTVGTGVAPDVAIAGMFGQRDDGTGALIDWSWSVIAPGTSNGAVVYPVLPTDVFDFNFHSTDSITRVSFVAGATAPGGYDAVRPHGFSFNPTDFIVGASGRTVAAELQLPPVGVKGMLRGIRNNAPARRLFRRH